jgi:hypothetical protein
VTIVFTGSGFRGRFRGGRFGGRAVTMLVMAGGYLPKRLEMRDSGLFGRPRSHDPLLTIWMDGFDPIGVADGNDPVGLHVARYGHDPLRGRNAHKWLDREGSGGAGRTR